MRCAYLGLSRGAVALCEAGHELTAVGLGRRPVEPGLEALRRALPRDCPILLRPDLSSPAVRLLFTTSGAERLVCFLWPRLLPKTLLAPFLPDRTLAYHPSLLPRHRGADPYFWTLWSGDERAGVSIFQVDPGVDTGLVLEQRSLAVPGDIDAGGLADRLDALGLERLVDIVGRLGQGELFPGVAQDEAAATLAPSPDDDLLELDWSRPASELARLVRAASPHPGAFTFIGDEQEALVVLAAREVYLERPGALRSGDVVLLEEGVALWASDGGLLLTRVCRGPGPPLETTEAIAALIPGLSALRPP